MLVFNLEDENHYTGQNSDLYKTFDQKQTNPIGLDKNKVADKELCEFQMAD